MITNDDFAARVKRFWRFVRDAHTRGALVFETCDGDAGVPLCYRGWLKELKPQASWPLPRYRYELTQRGRVQAFEDMMKARR
jgi:predicted amidohydrolase